MSINVSLSVFLNNTDYQSHITVLSTCLLICIYHLSHITVSLSVSLFAKTIRLILLEVCLHTHISVFTNCLNITLSSSLSVLTIRLTHRRLYVFLSVVTIHHTSLPVCLLICPDYPFHPSPSVCLLICRLHPSHITACLSSNLSSVSVSSITVCMSSYLPSPSITHYYLSVSLSVLTIHFIHHRLYVF
jgi:hypothetical protein